MILGSDRKGASILAQIAAGTGGSFVHVTDPAKLPEAFLDLRTTGIESVSLRVNDSAPIATRLVGGTFSGRVPLSPGVNRISAIAKSLTGETREDVVTVAVSGPLALEIDSPGEGTLLSNQGRGNLVEGRVNAFASLRGAHQFDLTGIDVREVVLETGDGAEVVAQVANGRFSGRVRLREGTNQIRAIATTVDGRTARDSVTVEVQARGCAQLEAVAYRDSQPALSLSDRSVEIVLDGSNSMWGRMGGRPKIAVAREILLDALDWLPRDVQLGFRAYGHRRPRKARDCQDSELLVPFGSKNRDQIRHAIAGMKPKGQTPLAYSLAQLQSDFGARGGERAVVLVTDGIESCGGDPRQEALALGRANTPVHVIGFGLGSAGDEDLSSLRAIASSSGGRFLLARSAEELRGALAETVGTPFQVSREGRVVARGALGSGERLRLPEGRYLVELESEPAQQVRVTLTSNQGLTLAWERKGETITHSEKRRVVDYEPCSALPESLPASPR